MEAGRSNQLGNRLRHEEQTGRLHPHYSSAQLDPPTDGGQCVPTPTPKTRVPQRKHTVELRFRRRKAAQLQGQFVLTLTVFLWTRVKLEMEKRHSLSSLGE